MVINGDNLKRKEERLKLLIPQCRLYKGETAVPEKLTMKQRKVWQYEKEWANLLADSFTNRDKLVGYMEKRLGKNITYHEKLHLPKSLFAYFVSRCDSSQFVHEWFYEVFELLSGTYSNKSAHVLFSDYCAT